MCVVWRPPGKRHNKAPADLLITGLARDRQSLEYPRCGKLRNALTIPQEITVIKSSPLGYPKNHSFIHGVPPLICDGKVLEFIQAGQIIATSHDLAQKVAEEGKYPLISGKSRLVKYYNLARYKANACGYDAVQFWPDGFDSVKLIC